MVRPFRPYDSNLRTEPDMRAEFINMMEGSYPEIAKKQTMILRKMRTDSVGELILCDCVDLVTKEPDKDTFCFACMGERYVWDEEFVTGYRRVSGSDMGLAGRERLISPGNTNLAHISFYFDYTFDLNLFPKRVSPDKIVELMTDVEGDPIRPYQRKTIYRIGAANDFRSDNGRLEYWRIDCVEEQVKFLNSSKG